MNMLNELRQMQDQMVTELTQVPLYRALKSLDRFIVEIEQIYEKPSDAPRTLNIHEKLAQIVEAGNRPNDPSVSPNAPKVTPYIPAQRVA